MILQSRLLVMALAMGSFISCTTTTAVRVKPDDFKTEGIRYWLAAPYLLVKEPVEVARTEMLFRYNVGEETLTPLVATPNAQPAKYGDASAWEKLLPGIVFAKQQGGGFGTGEDDDDTPGEDDDEEEGEGKAKTSPPAPAQAGKVELVWLPDYCHQYAIHQTTILAKQTQKLTLGDGWRFVSFEATQDSTDIAGKVLDLVGAVVGAGAAAEEPAEGEDEGEEEAEAGERIHLKMVTVTYVPPGLYPLVTRADCTALPTIDLNLLKHDTRTVWEVLEVSP